MRSLFQDERNTHQALSAIIVAARCGKIFAESYIQPLQNEQIFGSDAWDTIIDAYFHAHSNNSYQDQSRVDGRRHRRRDHATTPLLERDTH